MPIKSIQYLTTQTKSRKSEINILDIVQNFCFKILQYTSLFIDFVAYNIILDEKWIYF